MQQRGGSAPFYLLVSQAGPVGMRAAFSQQADSITKSCLQGGTSFVCDYGLRSRQDSLGQSNPKIWPLEKSWAANLPLTTNAKSCSDLAEIFSVGSFIYLKNIIFYALIFYLALLKSY